MSPAVISSNKRFDGFAAWTRARPCDLSCRSRDHVASSIKLIGRFSSTWSTSGINDRWYPENWSVIPDCVAWAENPAPANAAA